MKKLFAVMLAVLMLAGMVSCSGSGKKSVSPAYEQETASWEQVTQGDLIVRLPEGFSFSYEDDDDGMNTKFYDSEDSMSLITLAYTTEKEDINKATEKDFKDGLSDDGESDVTVESFDIISYDGHDAVKGVAVMQIGEVSVKVQVLMIYGENGTSVATYFDYGSQYTDAFQKSLGSIHVKG